MPTNAAPRFRNRIVGHGEEAPDQLLANPDNWRIHPTAQEQALEGVLEEVGYVQDVVVNTITGHMVDGHLRVSLALRRNEATVPVTYVELTPEEEAKILLTFDAITGLAVPDKEKVADLVAQVQTGSEAVQQMIERLAQDSQAYYDRLQDQREQEDRGLDTESADDDASERPPSTGEDLARLQEVTIAEPEHEVVHGEVYLLSNHHILVVARVFDEWALWTPYLDSGALLAPFAGPFIPLTIKAQAQDRRIVLVQPDPYIAGHVLDNYATFYGEDAVKRVAP